MSTKDLLILAMEECSEVIQALSKSIRFGSKSHHPNRKDTTNADRVMTEYYELSAIIEKLQDKGELPRFSNDKIKYIKKDKIQRANKWNEAVKNKNRGR